MEHLFAKPSLHFMPLLAALLVNLSAFIPQLSAAADLATPEKAALPDLGNPDQRGNLSVSPGTGGVTFQSVFDRQKLIIAPEYSNESGASLGVTLASMLGEDAAVGVLLNVGADKKELLINAGYKIDERQHFIVTVGQLKQFLNFAFASGAEKVGLTQSSGAVSYQLQLGKEFLRFLEVNGYVAKTASRDLSDKTFAIDAATLFELWNDPRRIAGGQVSGLQGKLGFSPIEGSTVKVSFGYEHLSYDLLAGKDSTNRLTGGLEWLQQLPDRLLLKFSADTYSSQNHYSAGLSRSFNGVGGGHHNLGFRIDSIRGRDGVGNDTQYKLLYTYAFGAGSTAGGGHFPTSAMANTPIINPGLAAQRNTADVDTPESGLGIRLLESVAQRPRAIPSHVVAKIDQSASPQRLIIIAKPGLPAGSTIDATTADITTPLGAVVTGIASVTRNAGAFANTGQFLLSANSNLITRPSQIVQPAVGFTDTYVVTINNQGGGTTVATIVVSHGSVKIDSITINHQIAPVTPEAPAVTADDTANTVSGFNASTMEVALSTDGGASYGAYGALPADLSGDKKLHVRVKAAGINPAGADTTLSFTTNPVTPEAPAVTADDTANTVSGFNASTMEVALSTDGGANYGAYGALPADLSGDKMLRVRVKAAGINPAGADTTLSFTTNPVSLPPGYIQHGGLTWTPDTIGGITQGWYGGLGITDWATANSYCTSAQLNGQAGWRLPTTTELLALGVSYRAGTVTLPAPQWAGGYIWSSIEHGSGNHENVDLTNPNLNWYQDNGEIHVTCVHN